MPDVVHCREQYWQYRLTKIDTVNTKLINHFFYTRKEYSSRTVGESIAAIVVLKILPKQNENTK